MAPSYPATPAQVETLLNFLAEHRDLARGLLRNAEGRVRAKRLWESISDSLNSMRGRRRSVEQWQKLWTDRKHSTKKNVALAKESPGTVLSENEQKIAAIMGWGTEDTRNFSTHDTQASSEQQQHQWDSSAPDSQSTQFQEQPEETPNDNGLDQSQQSSTDTEERTVRQRIEPMASPYAPAQIEALLDFLAKHRDLAHGLSRDVSGRDRAKKLWRLITITLNSMDGCKKSVDQWQRVWSDKKHATKKNVTAAILAASAGKSSETCLTENERKIMAIMGWDFKDEPPELALATEASTSQQQPQGSLKIEKGEPQKQITPQYNMEPNTPIATPAQMEALLNFLEEHLDLARGLLRDACGRKRAKRLWLSISNSLNAMGGCKKTVQQWYKVWTDKKYATKKNAFAAKKSGTILTANEYKILSIMGWSQVPQIEHSDREKQRKPISFVGNEEPNVEKPLEIKTEKNYIEFEESTCRVCLKQGNIPIYGEKDISKDLNLFAGIQVSQDESYPKYLCHPCNQLLESAILLRNTAQSSDRILRQAVGNGNTTEVSSNHDDYHNGTIRKTESDDSATSLQSKGINRNKISVRKTTAKKQRVFVKYNMEHNNLTIDNNLTKTSTTTFQFRCSQCVQTFDSYAKYDAHRKTKEHKSPVKICRICNKGYKSLKGHYLAVHNNNKPFMCDVCGKRYTSKSLLTLHRDRHFLSELPFKCSLCPYRGREKPYLTLHMKTHTNERKYQCPHCPTRFFISKSNWNKHMYTHKTDHDYKCELCQKGFHMKCQLNTHIKVAHYGFKDHKCSLCDKSFGTRKQMMKHQLKIHKRAKHRAGAIPLYKILESKKQQEQSESIDHTGDISLEEFEDRNLNS